MKTISALYGAVVQGDTAEVKARQHKFLLALAGISLFGISLYQFGFPLFSKQVVLGILLATICANASN